MRRWAKASTDAALIGLTVTGLAVDLAGAGLAVDLAGAALAVDLAGAALAWASPAGAGLVVDLAGATFTGIGVEARSSAAVLVVGCALVHAAAMLWCRGSVFLRGRASRR
ncbi:MAG: hypothetical protein JRH20_30375 [Deltaproteobacteria bacterium]|nr:hypothetical protein [Deltaproteobacteria bacterium]